MFSCTKFSKCTRHNFTLLLTIICIVIGVGVGAIMRTYNAPEVATLYVGLLGELFMRALNFSVLPLLSCNIIAVTAKMNPSKQGWVAMLSLAYCVGMNLIGSFAGMTATMLIKPGNRLSEVEALNNTLPKTQTQLALVDVFPDFLRNIVPDNILKTLLYSTVTSYVPVNVKNPTNSSEQYYKRDVGVTVGPNVLGILASSLVLGLIAGSRGEKTRPVIALAEAVADMMTVLIEKTVSLLPFAMISLIASSVARLDSVQQGLISLALFIATAATYLTCMGLIVLPLFFFITTRHNPFSVYAAIGTPLLTAFSLASSLIALPDLFKSCDRLGIKPHLVRAIAPFLTSFNANGSAAFITSAVCFTAQVSGHPLNMGQLIAISLLSGINVMALPAVPSASLITVFLIMRVFGIPDSAVSLLFVVEFIVDRMRTVLNVLSHGTCIAFVNSKAGYTDELNSTEEGSPACDELGDSIVQNGKQNQDSHVDSTLI